MKITTNIIDLTQPFNLMFATVEPGEVTAERFCYVESDHLGVGGTYADQPFEHVMSSIRECIENGDEDQTSEFILYLAEGIGLHIAIGNLEYHYD